MAVGTGLAVGTIQAGVSSGIGQASGTATNAIGSAWQNVLGVASGIMSGIPSFGTGGRRVFTTPSLISVAEHGPEIIEASPLSSGGMRGGPQVVVRLGAGAVIDEMSFYSFTRRLTRELERRTLRGLGQRKL